MKNYLGEMVDLTGDGYLNPVGASYDNGPHQRPEAWITSIAVHHDAQFRPHDYDSVARYKAEAALHYNTLGPGLQYHYKIDNTGVIFRVRPHTTWLYAVGSGENTSTINICLDGYFHPDQNQEPTLEQYEALKQLLDWLSTQNPQFSAAQGDVYPHRHYSSTACCGNTLVPFVDGYRQSGGNVALPNVPYDWPELQPDAQTAPAPTPTPVPQPTPASPPDGSPHVLVVNYRVYKNGKQIGAYKQADNAVNKYRAEGGDAIKDGNGNDVTAQLIHVVEEAPHVEPAPIVPPVVIVDPPASETPPQEDPKPPVDSLPPSDSSTTGEHKQVKISLGDIVKKVLSALSGKKTYIGIAVGAVYSVLIQLGVVENNQAVWTAIATWTGVAFRLAVSK